MSDHTDLEHAAARLALDAFGVPADAELIFVKQRENHVYRVRGEGFDRSLRMHRIGYRSDDELASETASIEAFHLGGIAVPTPVPLPSGEFVAVITDARGERRQATMQDWVDGGREFADSGAVFQGLARPEDAQLRALGTLIARMHDIAESGAPAGYRRAAWDAAGLVGEKALWGRPARLRSLSASEQDLLDRAEERLAEELGRLDAGSRRYGVIHADFTFENVLVVPDGLVALDFDDSGEGWFVFDLATAAFWCAEHPDAESLIAALLEGYREVRTLDEADEAAWHALLLARALSYLGWAADRPGDAASDFHEDVIGPLVVAAARRYLQDGTTGWPSLGTPYSSSSEDAR